MRLELNLQPLTRHDQPLVFGWDSETGELWGRDGERVKHMVRLASASNYVPGMPGDGGDEPTELLRNESKFRKLLKTSHALPSSLLGENDRQENYHEEDSDIY